MAVSPLQIESALQLPPHLVWWDKVLKKREAFVSRCVSHRIRGEFTKKITSLHEEINSLKNIISKLSSHADSAVTNPSILTNTMCVTASQQSLPSTTIGGPVATNVDACDNLEGNTQIFEPHNFQQTTQHLQPLMPDSDNSIDSCASLPCQSISTNVGPFRIDNINTDLHTDSLFFPEIREKSQTVDPCISGCSSTPTSMNSTISGALQPPLSIGANNEPFRSSVVGADQNPDVPQNPKNSEKPSHSPLHLPSPPKLFVTHNGGRFQSFGEAMDDLRNNHPECFSPGPNLTPAAMEALRCLGTFPTTNYPSHPTTLTPLSLKKKRRKRKKIIQPLLCWALF